MDIQDEQDKNRRSSSVTFSFIGEAPQAHGVSFVNGTSVRPSSRLVSDQLTKLTKLTN
jgi:hypothetical protein